MRPNPKKLSCVGERRYLIGDTDVRRLGPAGRSGTIPILFLQPFDCRAYMFRADVAAAWYIVSADDGDVEGVTTLWGRCRHGVRDGKSKSDDYWR